MLTLWSIILFCVILFLIILLGLCMLHVYWTFLKKKSLRMQIFSILLYPCIRLKYEDIVINNSKMSF